MHKVAGTSGYPIQGLDYKRSLGGVDMHMHAFPMFEIS